MKVFQNYQCNSLIKTFKYSSWEHYTWRKTIVQEAFAVKGVFWNSFQSVLSAYVTQTLFLEGVFTTSHIFVSYKILLPMVLHYKYIFQTFINITGIEKAWRQNCSFWKQKLSSGIVWFHTQQRKGGLDLHCSTFVLMIIQIEFYQSLTIKSLFKIVLFLKNNPVNVSQQ